MGMLKNFVGNRNKQLFFSNIKQVPILKIIIRSKESLIFFFGHNTSEVLSRFFNLVKSRHKDFSIRYSSTTTSIHFLLNFKQSKVNVFWSFDFKNRLVPQIPTKTIMQLI